MKKRINYGDNLFLLTVVLKDLMTAARLNIDPDFFLDKLIEDIFFLDASIGKFMVILNENPHLIDRLEHLKSLQRLSQALVDFLKELRAGQLPISEYLQSFEDKFLYLEGVHQQIVRKIDDTIQASEARSPEDEYIVSEREFQFLLSEDDDVAPDSDPTG